MNLYGSELAFEINVADSCPSDKFLKLCEKIVARYGPEVRKVYL